MYIGLHVKYSVSCHILVKLELFGQIFEKYSNTTGARGSLVVKALRY